MKNIFKIILVAVLTVMSSALITFIVLSELPNIKNNFNSLRNSLPKVLIIRSNSMSPKLPTGSAIAVKPSSFYKRGDVISFSTENDFIITHRISEVVSNQSGDISYITKGDANTGVDRKTVPYNKVIGVGIWALPYIGYLLSFLKTKVGFTLLVLTPAVLIIFSELADITKEINKILKKRNEIKTLVTTFSLSKLLFIPLLLLPFSFPIMSNAIFSDTEASNTNISTIVWGEITPTPQQWDKSSLYFDEEYSCHNECQQIQAKVCNGNGSEDMMGSVSWELYWIEKGNPKNGDVVEIGLIDPLSSGECQILQYVDNNSVNGNYMFKSYQRPGHPGVGELWSEECNMQSCEVSFII